MPGMVATPTSGLMPTTPAAWSSSGRFLSIPFGRVIRTYDVSDPQSPLLVSTQCGHTAPITRVVTLPSGRLASASLDGTLQIWDMKTGKIIRTRDMAEPISHIAYVHPDKILCYTQSSLILANLVNDDSTRRVRKHRKLLTGMLTSTTGLVEACEDGSLMVAADSTRVNLTSAAKQRRVTTLNFRHVVTSIALSLDGNRLAVGDETGAIYIFVNPSSLLSDSSKRRLLPYHSAKPSCLHWHSSAVRALTFTAESAVLLSAGSEAVLVSWNVSPSNFGSRRFLPRLTAPILSVSMSADSNLYALSRADNSLCIIDQRSFTVTSTIRGVAAPILDFSVHSPMALLSTPIASKAAERLCMVADVKQKGGLWIAGRSPCLQLFDVLEGKHVREVSVFDHNFSFDVKKTQLEKDQPSLPSICMMSLHPSGTLLATMDYRKISSDSSKSFGTVEGIANIRIWKRQDSAHPFEIFGVISQPHGSGSEVASICFHPSLPILASTSRNGTFALWRATYAEGRKDSPTWRREIELSYKKKPCNSVCFSSDGSLLAVACGHILTLWHFEDILHEIVDSDDKRDDAELAGSVEFSLPCSAQVDFLYALVHPPEEEQIQAVSFSFSKVPLFIAATKNGIYAWNALTRGIWWSSRVHNDSRSLAIDMQSGRFALPVKVPALAESDSRADGSVGRHLEPGSILSEEEQAENCAHNSANSPRGGARNSSHLRREAVPPSSRNGTLDPESMRTSDTPKRPRIYPRSDTAIAVFEASSPVPLEVRRLPSGCEVAGLAFLPLPGLQGDKRSAVVCIDSSMDVNVYHFKDTEDGIYLGNDEKIFISPEQKKRRDTELRELLETDWDVRIGDIRGNVDSPEQRVTESTDTSLETAPVADRNGLVPRQLNRVFQEHFEGPVHFQPRPSLNASGFICTLLQAESVTAFEKEKASINSEPDSTGAEYVCAADADPVGGTLQEGSNSMNNLREFRSFCKHLLHTKVPKLAD